MPGEFSSPGQMEIWVSHGNMVSMGNKRNKNAELSKRALEILATLDVSAGDLLGQTDEPQPLFQENEQRK